MIRLILIISHLCKISRSWSFSNMISVIRQQLMNYINIYRFLEDPEGAWIAVNRSNKINYQGTLFPEMRGAWL